MSGRATSDPLADHVTSDGDAERGSWLEHTIRRSDRARRMRIRVTPRGDVEVVLPRGATEAEAERFIAREREWIERALARIERQRASIGVVREAAALPSFVDLRATGGRVSVSYRPTAAASASARRGRDGILTVSGPVRDEDACMASLRRWLFRTAKDSLPDRLGMLADRHGFSVSGVAVRRQRTRWGSCSGRSRLSLNAKLLFLPPDLVDHVLVHELCHTVHPHHSDRFWRLVERHDPAWREHREALSAAWAYVPRWVDGAR